MDPSVPEIAPARPRVRRWPVVLAFIGVLSLPLLAVFAPTEGRLAERDQQELLRIRDELIQGGQHRAAEQRLRAFLTERARSPWRPFAHFLMSRAILGRAERGPFPGVEDLNEVWNEHLPLAQAPAPDARLVRPSDVFEERRRVARILAGEGLFEDAAKKLDELFHLSGSAEILLDLSELELRRAESRPDKASEHHDKAIHWAEEFLATQKGPARAAGILQKARVHWKTGAFARMRAVLDDAIARFDELKDPESSDPAPQPLVELRFQRGRALSMLDEHDAALADLGFASDRFHDFRRRDLAEVHRVAVLGRRFDPECQRRAEPLIRSGPPHRAVTQILLGRFFLETNRALPYEMILAGFRELEGPELLEEERIDVAGLYARLRETWEKSAEAEELERMGEILARYRDLYPAVRAYWRDTAFVHAKAAEGYRERARARDRVGDRAGAEELRARARSLFYRSAETFVDFSRRPDLGADVLSDALFGAARAYFEGGWFQLAAKYFRDAYERRPDQNHAGLYHEALSYAREGMHESEFLGEPNAIDAFTQYIRLSPQGSPYVHQSLLERGRIFLRIGRHAEAATDFDLILTRMDFGLGPEAREWREALRLKGTAEMERAAHLKDKTADPSARSQFVAAVHASERALSGYIARYVEKGTPTRHGLRAVFDLARLHMVNEDWIAAERRLQQVLGLAPRIEDEPGLEDHEVAEARAEADESLFRAHFLVGDVLLALGRNPEAYDAFSLAYNRYVARPERLWGLIGQARAAIRLGRKDEARRLHQRAVELFDRNRETYESSLAGFGKDYWRLLIQVLEKELE